MRKALYLILALVALPMLAVVALADDSKADSTETEAKELEPQTLCPVMGGKIDSTAYTDIQGQRVYFCCPGCSSKLTADPDKYFKKAAAEGVLFENIQTVCPISGQKLKENSVHVDYEGRRIYFCCDGCKPVFGKDPHKYLAKLDTPPEPQEEQKQEQEEPMKHEGHEHHNK